MRYKELKDKFNKEYPEIFYHTATFKNYFNGELIGCNWRILRIKYSINGSTIEPVMSGFAHSVTNAEIKMNKIVTKMEWEDKKEKRKAWRNKKKEYKEAVPFLEWMAYGCAYLLMAIMGFTFGALIFKWILWVFS